MSPKRSFFHPFKYAIGVLNKTLNLEGIDRLAELQETRHQQQEQAQPVITT